MGDNARNLKQALQSRGYRLTAARQAVLDVLAESGGHLSADELAETARRREPGLGRMTVYRTLDLLCELELIRPLYQGKGAAQYVLLEDGRHHHLVCSKCDRVIEFKECAVEEIERMIGGRYGFDVRGHLLELYGFCIDCQS